MPMRGEPGRPEFKARRFHTPVENAIYLGGTSATRPVAEPAHSPLVEKGNEIQRCEVLYEFMAALAMAPTY
jgi:hypothetical protein